MAVVNVPAAGVVAPITVPLIDPPVTATDEDAKLFAVTRPVPNVTGLLVTVLIERVVADVVSMTGLDALRFVVTLLKVTVPVPVEKVFVPVTEVGPFRDTAPLPVPNVPVPFCRNVLLAAMDTLPFKLTAPVPVENVFAPVWLNVLSRVVAPCRVKVPGVVVEPIVLIDEAPEPNVFVVDDPVARVVLLVDESVVNAPVEGLFAPIGVLSMLPPVTVTAGDENVPTIVVVIPL